MKKVFEIVAWEVDNSMLQKFIEIQRNSSDDTETIVFLETSWWNSSVSLNIVDVINNTKNITLVGQNDLFSAWFNIFFLSKCKKRINDICNGMCHMGWFTTHTNHVRRAWEPVWETRCSLHNVKTLSNKLAKFYRETCGMSKKDVKAYLDDYDVYFSKRRMQKMIDFQNKTGYNDR